MKYEIEKLNNEQKQAVLSTEKYNLILAGAGTGKTKVLTTKIAYILENKLAYPYQILALTFTNKASDEMKKRVSNYCNISNIWIGTFHSICLRILKTHYEKANLTKDFIIFSEEDQKSIIKNILKNTNIKNIENSIDRISFIKDTGEKIKDENLKLLYNQYNKEIAKLNGVDFGDIILKVIKIFKEYPEILKKYQNQFKYVLVDEFQDTNNVQYDFLKLICNRNTNVYVVGDDDQSIYSWRGAEISHILNFPKDYKGTSIIKLIVNYRSTDSILGVANSLIKNNKNRLGKELVSFNGDVGEKVKVRCFINDLSEVSFISRTILNEQLMFDDCAILIRNGSIARIFEEDFIAKGIPYQIIGTVRFYDRMEIRDIIAYLRVLVHPFDDLAFLRIINKPKRTFGTVFINNLYKENTDLFSALKNIKLTSKQRIMADSFLKIFDFDWKNMPLVDVANRIVEKSGYTKYLASLNDGKERIMNVKDLITDVISKYDTLEEFLEHASLMTVQDNDENQQNVVKIMTVHASKGLEFNIVFLPAFEDDIIPNPKSDIEEERRLAYVAITRAKKRLFITHAENRQLFGEIKRKNPSQFIDEMDRKYLDFGVVKTKVGLLVEHKDFGKGVVIKEENYTTVIVAFMNKKIKKIELENLEFI